LTSPPEPDLPRSPKDEANLRRLRKEARRRLAEDEGLQLDKLRADPVDDGSLSERLSSITVYGGPIWGGEAPAGQLPDESRQPVTRRWTLRGILLLILGLVAAMLAALFGLSRRPSPVYGGPPAPVYGGPPPKPQPSPPPSSPPTSHP
jgi:hypothetical protein